MNTQVPAAARPANGTGEVVIIRTESPTADIWAASWDDVVIGPSEAPLAECLAWAWSEDVKPSQIRIITSNPVHSDLPGLILTQCVSSGSDEVRPDGTPLS